MSFNPFQPFRGFGGGAAPFSPLSLSPALWLSDTGSDPAQWDDLSGNGRHATQATAGLRPAIVTGAINGRQVRRCNGSVSGHVMQTAYVLPSNHTAFFVAKRGTQQNDTSSILRPVLESASSSTNDGLRSYGTQRGTLENLEAGIENTRVTTVSGNWLTSETIVATFLLSGTILTSYKNGGLYGSVTMSPLASHAVYVGGTARTDTGGSARRFAGDIAEILVFATALAAGDRQNVERYLGAKYGISVA